MYMYNTYTKNGFYLALTLQNVNFNINFVVLKDRIQQFLQYYS